MNASERFRRNYARRLEREMKRLERLIKSQKQIRHCEDPTHHWDCGIKYSCKGRHRP